VVTGLHINMSSSLRTLGRRVAELFAAPAADPFVPEYVVVPTLGIRDFLRTVVAGELGVTCNVEVVFPGEFTTAALGQPVADTVDPWSVLALTWAVLDQMRAGTVDVPGRVGVSEARHIANLFDRYAVNRPSIIQQWAVGRDGDGTEDHLGAVVPLPADQHWQAELWRAVRSAIGAPSLAEQLPDLLTGVARGAIEPHLPPRVVLFGLTSLPPAQLGVVRALAAVRDVHVMVLHPSPAARASSKLALAGRLVQRRDADALSGVRHPVLRSWGRSTMESAVLLAGTAAIDDVAVGEPAAGTLLAALQQSIAADGTATMLAALDDSVQVHACHGPLRQLEVLRDALGHLFVADATLQPHEVVVVCPDLTRFAPLAESVFGRGDLAVPLRVSDVAAHDGNPVAAAMLHVLQIVDGRCTVADVLELCADRPVQRALGLTIDDIALFQGWVDELGTRWGIDLEHRHQFLTTAIDDATWSQSVDRLLVGAAMPAPMSRRVLDGISPYDDIDAQRFESIGRLATLIGCLRTLREAASIEHTVDEWCATFAEVMATLCHGHPDQPWDVLDASATLDSIVRSAHGAGRGQSIGFSDMRAILRAEFADRRGRLALRSGKVSMTSMIPVRSVPARVVCVLGLEEGSLRGSGADGDDVLGTRPCVGERDGRAEGRALLLDALMAAGDHFIVTCDGHDVTTNRAVPLPVVVTELLDAVTAVAATSGTGGAVVHQHSRYGYAESNLAVESPFTFDRSMLLAAERLRQPVRSAGTFQQRLAPTVPRHVTLPELVDGCYRPARVFLRDRLDITLPRDSEAADPHVPLTASKLHQAELGRDLVAQQLGGGNEAEWRAASQRAGTLPPRQLAIGVLDAVSSEVSHLLAAALDRQPDVGAAVRGTEAVDLDLELSAPLWAAGESVGVRLVDRVVGLSDTTMLRLEFSRPHHRFELDAALRLAALVVAFPDEHWRAVIVTRGESKRPAPLVIDLDPVADGRVEAATTLLEVALDLRLRALCEPIPLFERSSREMFDIGTLADDELFENPIRGGDRSEMHTGFIWGSFSAEEMLAVPYQPGVDDGIPEVRVPGFANPSRAASYATYLWSAVRAFVPGGPT
jgi:exodeoxyribonuclease V gamma subunit